LDKLPLFLLGTWRTWLWQDEPGFEIDKVDEVGDKGESGEGSREHRCTHYLDVTSEVAIKKAVKVSEC
jgi:hypothetical protein